MRQLVVMFVLVFLLGLTACGGPADGLSDQTQEDLPQQEDVADVEDTVAEIENLEDELDMEDLDGVEEDLDTI